MKYLSLYINNFCELLMMTTFEVMRSELFEAAKQSFDDEKIDLLERKYDTYSNLAADRRAALDQVMRDFLLELLKNGSDIYVYETFVTFCIESCRKDMCTATMPVVLLGDIFDALTLNKCEELFVFVENGVNIWKEELFFSSCKNNLLRMCNDLLRRLSRSQNTVFCGRILLFLAKFFPFSERSGLNIVSEFNLDNVTEFGNQESTSNLKDILGEKEYSTEDEAVTSDPKLKIDYNLYCKFWSLQEFFRNPNQCYNKVHWKAFSTHANNVLQAFKSFKLEDLQDRQRSLDASQQQETAHYFAKYLTNQKLLELQLSDANFRRYVLVQFLIIFQYLNSPVKFKAENQELKSDQVEWIKETTDLIYSLLAETPPDGEGFVKSVKHMLKREEYWNSWKNEGCPQFQRKSHASGSVDDGGPSRQKKPKKYLGDTMKEAQAQGKIVLGNSELTKLWNLSTSNLEACKSKDRDFLPSLDSYFEEAMEQADPAFMIEEQYKCINKGNFGWRALRLLARKSPHFFTQSTTNQINKLPEYLETMVKKIIKDKPSQTNTVEDTQKSDGNLDCEMTETVNEADEEMLKNEEKDAMRQNKNVHIFSEDLLDKLSQVLIPSWRRVALKLGFTKEDIEDFETIPKDKQIKKFLHVWSIEDEDASLEGFIYLLEGLELNEAAEICKVYV